MRRPLFRSMAAALFAVLALAGSAFTYPRTLAIERRHARETVAFVAHWVPRVRRYHLSACRVARAGEVRCPFVLSIQARLGGTITCKSQVQVGPTLESTFAAVRCERTSRRHGQRTAGRRLVHASTEDRVFGRPSDDHTGTLAVGAPCGVAAHPECQDIANAVGDTVKAACGQELGLNPQSPDWYVCVQRANTSAYEALAKCLNDNHVNGDCGPCEICLQGQCFPACVSCQQCDAATGVCVDTCAAANPCMVCRQNECQSDCADSGECCQGDGTCQRPASGRCEEVVNGRCQGCDTTCERCDPNTRTCVSKCAGPAGTCCVGQCLNCCHSLCDRGTGTCAGSDQNLFVQCDETQTCCAVQCTDLTTDRDNCGMCGHQCKLDIETCIDGQCRPFCNSNYQICAAGQLCCPDASGLTTMCVPSDDNNCGSCGNVCPPGYHCDGQRCSVCSDDAVCAPSKCCNGRCADTQIDVENCGTCGNACPLGDSCCTGQCVDTQSDPNNCGTCGNICAMGETCQSGMCVQQACGNPPQYCGTGQMCCLYTRPAGAPGSGVASGICIDPSIEYCCPTWGACPTGWKCCPQCCMPALICCADPNRCGKPDGTGC